MTKNDFKEFHSIWFSAHAMSSSNKEPADKVIMMVFDVLSGYPLSSVKAALKMHSQKSRFAPTPADIVEIISSGDGRPTADEAWALCPKTETATVVWTDEIAEAFGVCSELLADGDAIAARMAFKASYDRICNIASLQHKRPVYRVSLGHDKAGIEPVIQKAVRLGRITQEAGQRYLPAPSDGGVVGKLLTGQTVKSDSAQQLKNVRRLKSIIEDAFAKQDAAKEAARTVADNKKAEFEQRKKDAVDYCDSHAGDDYGN